jgi:hypothetical protein
MSLRTGNSPVVQPGELPVTRATNERDRKSLAIMQAPIRVVYIKGMMTWVPAGLDKTLKYKGERQLG